MLAKYERCKQTDNTSAMNYNVYPYLDKRNTGKDGRHAIKIAIGYNRKADYVNTEMYASAYEWQQLFSEKPPKHMRELRDKIRTLESKVKAILTAMPVYDIKVLRLQAGVQKKPFVSPNKPTAIVQPTELSYWFDLKIRELEELREAYGTADNYKDTKKFYIKYAEAENVDLTHFTKDELYRIQKKALATGMSAGNVYRHARQLRAIFNMAMFEGAIDKSLYPFHKRGYVIPQTTKRKKSLSRDNMGSLLNFKPVIEEERRALDYFIFSFFGNGMNIKDVAYLKYSDIYSSSFRFVRKKTEATNIQPKEIRVAITPEMHEVIKRQGNTAQSGYVFPIIKQNDTIAKQRMDYRNFNRSVNVHLRNICKQLNFTKMVTHGVSRYTFANALKQQGVPIDYISEAMGHSSTAVTEHYLNSFEDDIVSQHADKLRAYSGK